MHAKGNVRFRPALIAVAAACAASVCVAACTPGSGPPVPAPDGTTGDAVVRSTAVVPGRPARVFVMAAIGKSCEAVAEPQITIDQPPQKGQVTLQAGQETTIQYSLSGSCIGSKAVGTGIYYTANPGTSGADRFSITARLASGETATRAFDVTIAE